MAQTFAGGATVTTADHQHPLDRGRAAEGWMDQSLVVVALLALGRHPAAVEQQALAVTLAIDDRHPLEGALGLSDHGAGQAIAHAVKHLIDPAHGPWKHCLQDCASPLSSGPPQPRQPQEQPLQSGARLPQRLCCDSVVVPLWSQFQRFGPRFALRPRPRPPNRPNQLKH